MTSLRQTVSRQMVQAHGISQELADYHVLQMDAAELRWCFKNYVRQGAELSAAGPTIREVNVLPSRFATPSTTQAGSRPSIPVPGMLERGLKNRDARQGWAKGDEKAYAEFSPGLILPLPMLRSEKGEPAQNLAACFAADGPRPPRTQTTENHDGRDGGPANSPSRRDSAAFPLKGAEGVELTSTLRNGA